MKLESECIESQIFDSKCPKYFNEFILLKHRTAEADENGEKIVIPRPKNFRPLYDIPWMFEAREFLRKKLIGKRIQCNLDYISPARDGYPEKYCYTVTIGGM